MEDITQGTLISGVRSTLYPGVTVYGIIISAACDLAHDKIDKVFYLTAIPLNEWLCSDEGFRTITASYASDNKKALLEILEKNELSWDVVQTLSPAEFEIVATQCIKKGERDSAKKRFEKYYQISKEKLNSKEKAEVYRSDLKTVSNFLGGILTGSNTHYIFIPNQALSAAIPDVQGLIVDLLALDFFPLELVERIRKGAIDREIMSDAEIADYDKRFFLKENPGFAYPLPRVASPWREYLLQHFSNCFARIGVDNPGNNEAKAMVEGAFLMEELET